MKKLTTSATSYTNGLHPKSKYLAAKEIFTGSHAELANPLLKESYRKGYELPVWPEER